MANFQNNNSLSYGLQNALQSANPEYIFGQRAPSSSDIASFGTFWFYRRNDIVPRVFVYLNSGVWIELVSTAATPIFPGLIVNGPTALNGALTVHSGTNAIAIGNDATSKSIVIGSTTGVSPVTINAGTTGLTVNAFQVAENIGANGYQLVTTGLYQINTTSTNQVEGSQISIGYINQSGGIGVGAVGLRNISIGNSNPGTQVNISGNSQITIHDSVNVTISSPVATGFTSSLATSPSASSVVTAAFGTSLTAGTAVRNTTGYNILATISVAVTSATAATITVGVGSTNTPTKNTVIQSFSAAATTFFSFSVIIPNNYYIIVDTTGTIVVDSINVQSCGL